MDKTTREQNMALATARAYVSKHAPYVSSVLYNLRPVWTDAIPTMAVSEQLVCLINPEFFLGLDNEKARAACLYHEIMHILRDYHSRVTRVEDPSLYNIAADIPINDDLLRMNRGKTWPLPDIALTSKKFGFQEGLTSEAYYELLNKLPKVKIDLGGAGSGENGAEGGGNIGSDGQPYQLGDVRVENQIFSGGCGTVAGNTPSARAEETANKSFGHSKPQVTRIVKQGIKNLQRHNKANPYQGDIPSCMEHLLEWEDEVPIIPWRDKLKYVLRRASGRIAAGQADFSMRKPSRRSYALGILRPGMIEQKIVPAFLRDTSGSMGEEQLKSATIESCGVMSQLGVDKAWYMDADADVSQAKMVGLKELKTMPVIGGGGTNFIPGIEAMKKVKPRPDIVIYMTDGAGTAPEFPPKEFELVWCIVPSPYQEIPASWGTVIVMSDDKKVLDTLTYK